MSKLMKKSQDKKQIYQEQIFTCCFKYPVMNTNTHRNTHTHTATHTGTYTHIWMGQCTLIRDGMSLDAAIRVLLQHLGTHTVQKPLLTLSSGVASLPSHQAASMPWGSVDPGPCQHQLQLCPRSSGHKDCTGTCPHMDTPARPEQVSFSPNFIGMPWWLSW